MTGSTQLIGSGSDDGASAVTPIGFSFTYAGTVYNNFSANANGLVRLGTTAVTTQWTNSAANANTATPAIFPYWDDLATGSAAGGGKVHYLLTGTAPNQKLIIEWFVTVPRSTTGAANARFQCVLEETTNIVSFVYGTGMVANTGGASIGLATATTVYNTVTASTNTNTTSTFVTNNTGAITSGTSYIFTPPTPCSGTPVAGTVAPATQTLLTGQTPAALVASGYSSGVSGITFQWQESDDDGAADAWANAVGGTGANTASYTPPAFTTTKYYRLVVTCTNGGAFANTASVVLSACGAFTVPTLENFTTYVPGCWQEADNGDLTAGPATFGTSGWIADGFGNVGTTGAFRYEIWTTGANDWLLTPLYTIPATGYEIKFDAAATQWNTTNAPTTAWEADDFVEVLVSTGTTNWTVLYTFNDTNVPSNTGTPTIIDLDAYAGMDVRFAFRGVEGATNGGADIEFIVDNFEIRMTPACVEPTTLAATNITATSVDLSWVDPSGVQFDFEYALQLAGTGVPAGAGTPVAANSEAGVTQDIDTNALTANTAYEFYVRADCGGGGFSTWAGPFNFTTLCATFTAPFLEVFSTNALPSCWSQGGATPWEYGSSATTPTGFSGWGASGVPDHTSGGGGTFIGMDGSDNTNGEVSTLLTPMIDVSGLTVPQLSYWVFSNNVDDDAQNILQVEVYDGAAWNIVETIQSNLGTSWVEYTFNISSLTITGDVQVRFTVTGVANTGSTYTNDILIDDVSIDETPSCIAPTTLAATNITAGSVDLSWIDPSGVQFDFEYAVQLAGTGVPAGAGTPVGATSQAGITQDINLNALTANTNYEVYVRADCGGGDFSAWVGPINFTTSIEVVCGTPVNTTYCYTDNDTTSWTFTSSTGDPLRVTFNAGQVENTWDELIVLDSDGVTQLYNGYGAAGNLAGLTFDSTGDTITVMISSDGSTNCGDSGYTSWDFDVVCATCVNPTATYTVVPDCGNGQYSIDVDVTALGTATSLTITDGVTPLTMISTLGIQTFGPYADGASTTITLTNEQDAGCSISSGAITYVCPPSNDDCVNAIQVNCGDVVTGDTSIGATDSGSNASADVWYFYNGAAGDITVSLCTNTTFDSYLRIFDSCGGTQLTFNDDGCGAQSTVTFTADGTSTYYIMVEGFGTAEGAFELTTACVLSNDSFDSSAFLAYPNPVKDVLNLEYNSEISSVRVMNLLGQEVISRNINANSTQVDMSQLSAGAYIVNVTVGNAVKTIKVVKQ